MTYDAIIIGSGAAGSIMAYQLSRKGMRVLILEKGVRENPQTFEHNEMAMIPRLYKHGGLQTSADNDMVIMQGGAVGGSTVINNAIWLRADLDRVLPVWEEQGATLDRARIESAYAELERDLNVSPIPSDLINEGGNVFLKGCRALNIPARVLTHNRRDCLGCGWCNYGCRYNRKLSMLVTFLPWSLQLGAELHAGCSDVRLITSGQEVTEVVYNHERREKRARGKRVVVCAGAIGSSELLLRSGITQNGRVGKGFHLLGGVLVTAEMRDRLDSFDGIGLTCMADAGKEYIIETFYAPPGAFSVTLGGWFASHTERMKRYSYFAQAGVMVATSPRGTISVDRKGRTTIDLVYAREELRKLVDGVKMLSTIYFAAGALLVLPGTFRYIELTSADDLRLLDRLVRGPDDLLIGSAHPQGGNAICEDHRRGVVDTEFKVHGFRNLHLVDASVFPTNIWANCQATVMALSHYASDFVN